jgi:hypothetical protein
MMIAVATRPASLRPCLYLAGQGGSGGLLLADQLHRAHKVLGQLVRAARQELGAAEALTEAQHLDLELLQDLALLAHRLQQKVQ